MERLEILKCQSEDMKFGIDVNLDKIVAETEYFSGADLKALLHNAQLEAVHEYLAGDSEAVLISKHLNR